MIYNAAVDSDVPAPFDLELEPLFPLEEGIGGMPRTQFWRLSVGTLQPKPPSVLL